MNDIVRAIHWGGIAAFPRHYITKKLGLAKTATAWEFLRHKYAKHFGFGIEVRKSVPDFISSSALRARAMQAVRLALEHYGDMLIDADVQVKEGSLPSKNEIVTGYQIDLDLPWDFSKPVLIQITYDRNNRSYRIMGVVYNHLIDGVPLALYIYLIHNHCILGDQSFIRRSKRSFSAPYRFHEVTGTAAPGTNGWMELRHLDDTSLVPVGGQIQVTNSNIVRLRDKISRDTGQKISTASLETALIAMETGITWSTDYIAQGHGNSRGYIDAQKGYRGLGIVRMKFDDAMRNANPRGQYRWLCAILGDAAGEMKLERNARGWASLFYDRYSRIAPFFVNLFDRRIDYEKVQSVAGTQMIGSNLNGVDYGVPLYVGGVRPGDVNFIFIPSHGEHDARTCEERSRRSLETRVTEVSFSCGPRIIGENERSTVYKSLKLHPLKADEILLSWGHDAKKISALAPAEKAKLVFAEAYRPDNPAWGRIERRAALYLNFVQNDHERTGSVSPEREHQFIFNQVL